MWLQTDDYEGYHAAVKRIRSERGSGEGIKHVLCWSHVRRRFYKYWEVSRKRSEEAKEILYLIKEIFELEKLRDKYSLRGRLWEAEEE